MRVQGFGFRVQGLGFRIEGLAFKGSAWMAVGFRRTSDKEKDPTPSTHKRQTPDTRTQNLDGCWVAEDE